MFVIPSTNPTPFLQCMVSDNDVKNKRCCYVRGDDMLAFPGRSDVETVMPVHFLPRSEGVSSSMVRAIYHNKDASVAKKAAFASWDASGKPILNDSSESDSSCSGSGSSSGSDSDNREESVGFC